MHGSVTPGWVTRRGFRGQGVTGRGDYSERVNYARVHGLARPATPPHGRYRGGAGVPRSGRVQAGRAAVYGGPRGRSGEHARDVWDRERERVAAGIGPGEAGREPGDAGGGGGTGVPGSAGTARGRAASAGGGRGARTGWPGALGRCPDCGRCGGRWAGSGSRCPRGTRERWRPGGAGGLKGWPGVAWQRAGSWTRPWARSGSYGGWRRRRRGELARGPVSVAVRDVAGVRGLGGEDVPGAVSVRAADV